MDGGQTRTNEKEDAMWTFEPSAALEVYKDMLKDENHCCPIFSKAGQGTWIIEEKRRTIISIAMETVKCIKAAGSSTRATKET